MDLKITGAYIAQKRKEKQLTQLELATKLNISEKTVSKWECGNGFPDTSLILPLCENLSITANELLSGKDLATSEYVGQAEKNLVELKSNYQKNNKLMFFTEFVIIILSLIIYLSSLILVSYANISLALKIVVTVISFIIFVFCITLAVIIERNVGFYECKHCSYKYIPSYKSFIWSTHIGTTRKLRCPKCNKKSWSKKVLD